MKYAYADIYTIELPSGHRFPMEKYRRTRELLLAEGTITPSQLLPPILCDRETICRAHGEEYIDKVFKGEFDRSDELRLGFPWSPALVTRSRASVGGTLQAARHALTSGGGGNFAGGTHHAYADHGEGFCVFNDVAIAIRQLQFEELIGTAAVVDCDVHQGNGTASIFHGDSHIFTLSLHGKNNFPFDKEESTLDVELDDGTSDDEYLQALEPALKQVELFRPDIVFYNAGVDPLEQDQLGRLALTIEGLKQRDALVLSWAASHDLPIAICFGGGYAKEIKDIVESHANTFRLAEALFDR